MKKIYLIQPTYGNAKGELFKGNKQDYPSLALPALSSTIPQNWDREFCFEFLQEVNFDTDAQVIGISSMGYDIVHGMDLARAFKQRGKTVIFGGHQAYFSKTDLHGVCDAVVLGCPGPDEMKTILDDCAEHQVLPTYSTGVHIDFPFDYSILDGKKTRFMPILASIGCRNRCNFCCNKEITAGHYYLRSIDTIMADMRSARHKSRLLVFSDSNMFNHRKHLYELTSCMIHERINGLWGAQCTIDIGDDYELLQQMYKSGCRMLFVGIETLHQANMDQLEKKIDVSRHEKRIANIRQAGIAVGGYFMVGLDQDTRESFSELYDFIHRNRIVMPVVNILIPVPGTAMYNQLKVEGRILDELAYDFAARKESYAASSHRAFFQPKRMTVAELEANVLELNRRLTAWPEIWFRSKNKDITAMLSFLALNVGMRREYLALKRAVHV
jgi:tRNA A37 methylthiotransferase MiaB